MYRTREKFYEILFTSSDIIGQKVVSKMCIVFREINIKQLSAS
jgi:hypothetical protein